MASTIMAMGIPAQDLLLCRRCLTGLAAHFLHNRWEAVLEPMFRTHVALGDRRMWEQDHHLVMPTSNPYLSRVKPESHAYADPFVYEYAALMLSPASLSFRLFLYFWSSHPPSSRLGCRRSSQDSRRIPPRRKPGGP